MKARDGGVQSSCPRAQLGCKVKKKKQSRCGGVREEAGELVEEHFIKQPGR